MAGQREAIGKKKRFDVFKRDGFVCAYCGAHPPHVVLEVDHIDPVANGGSNHIDNLITACFNCNRGKRDSLLTEVPQSLAEKAKQIQESESQLMGYRDVLKKRKAREDHDAWEVVEELWPGQAEKGIPMAKLQSIRVFLERLDLEDVLKAVAITQARIHTRETRYFSYFCGVCWGKIRDKDGTRKKH